MKKPEKMRSSEYDKYLPKAKKYFKLDEKQIAKLRYLKENGIPTKDIAEMFSISVTSVKRYASDEAREKDVAYSKKHREKTFVPGVRKRTKKQRERLKVTDREHKKTLRGFFVSQYLSLIHI